MIYLGLFRFAIMLESLAAEVIGVSLDTFTFVGAVVVGLTAVLTGCSVETSTRAGGLPGLRLESC